MTDQSSHSPAIPLNKKHVKNVNDVARFRKLCASDAFAMNTKGLQLNAFLEFKKKGFKQRMIAIGQTISFYFLQNV